jgi:hypothetical protein
MGNVNVDELMGFSQRPELSPGAHDAALDGAALVAALCRSTTRLGTTILINESMVPMQPIGKGCLGSYVEAAPDRVLERTTTRKGGWLQRGVSQRELRLVIEKRVVEVEGKCSPSCQVI